MRSGRRSTPHEQGRGMQGRLRVGRTAVAFLSLFFIARAARAAGPVTREEAAGAVLSSAEAHVRLPPGVHAPIREHATALSHVVFGYLPDYVGGDLSEIRFDLLSHVGYF